MRRRKKQDWVLEQDKGVWRIYVGMAVILAAIAYVIYRHQVRWEDSPALTVEQLLDDED